MACNYYTISSEAVIIIELFNLVFMIIFIMEALIKIIA